MKQLALDIGLATGPTLTSFFAGPNEAVLQHLVLWVGEKAGAPVRSPVPTYLWGSSGSDIFVVPFPCGVQIPLPVECKIVPSRPTT